ncbi:hypothetical protein BN000_02938 [Neobacillus massiliamazoniensis]|uniref:Uncharacterized protein n=2 Tax=Neobacillus massiliamazoniensis TaxID=1499688 RepID=A0A0U1NYB6_9BACI|nr:hypothetical protein BN000_02938 [Neobacillus massiliamazoniensis]
MWVCTKHMKETLALLETPHVSKASYQIKCSLCSNLAIAKVYYSHQTNYFSKEQCKASLKIETFQKTS